MAIFRRPIPRRAFFAAALGALYALLILPPLTPRSAIMAGTWLLLAIGLLFARPLAYHAYSFWGILWVAYRSVMWFRERTNPAFFLLDLAVPLVSLALLMTSGYLESLRPQDPE